MLHHTPRLALVAALAGAPALAQADHSIALINDARSHGVVGDNLLSLNEVILLNKRALTRAQLSSAEQAQIQGTTGDIAWADIDFTTVAKITVQRDLEVIDNTPHGLIIAGSNGKPTVDLNGTRGFTLNGDFADFGNLVIENAATAITLNQNDALFGTVITSVTFRNLQSHAIHATMATSLAETRLQIEKCGFEAVPTAIEVFDTGANRRGNLLFLDSEIRGGGRGLAVHLGPGGMLNVLIERVKITGTTHGVVFDRGGVGNSRQVFLSSLHLEATGGTTGLSFEGHPAVPDQVTLRMFDLDGSVHGLRFWPLGTQLRATVEDARVGGGCELLAGAGPGIVAANLRMRRGGLVVGSHGAPVRVTDTILDQITVSTRGTAAARIDASRLVGGSLRGQAGAPLRVDGSYLGGA